SRRLVEEKDVRLLCKRACEHGTLKLAAGERAQAALRERQEIEALEGPRRCLAVATPLGREVAEVRRAPEEHVLADGQLRRRLRVLRDERDHPCELPPAEPAHVAAVEPRVAGERKQPAERAEHARLPGAVRADQHHPLLGGDVEREVAHRLGAVEADAEISELDHRIDLAVRRTTAKNGAPKNAVTTPIGSSPGDTTVRARTSASTRNPAPTTSDRGTTAR